MTQEDKELLLKDLCARLPYGIKCKVWYNDKTLNIKCTGIDFYTNTVNLDIPEDDNAKVYIDNIKPYLFPLSSMTEEQKKEFKEISKCEYKIRNYGGFDSEGVYLIEIGSYEYEHDINTAFEEFYFNHEIINWLNKNHFDYRGLIEKGLAINATELNIY